MGSHHVFFVSNGHGEDLMAARIAERLAALDPDLQITALPIVGTGISYQKEGIPLLLPGKILPSGGFARNGLGNVVMDLRAGLLSLTVAQCKALKKGGRDIDLAVCVGDVYALLLTGLFLRRPIVFLPTAKSDYIAPHWPIEISLMKRYGAKVFPRDAITAVALKAHGVNARFVGNVMMDCLDFLGPDLASGEKWIVGILPGGRAEAYENMKDIAEAILAFERLTGTTHRKPAQYLVALSGGLTYDHLAQTMAPMGWIPRSAAGKENSQGIVGYLRNNQLPQVIELNITQGRFADILDAADVVIGMAGTGNEQAVGLGKPVLTFAGRGPQFTPKFVKTQKKLLDGAIDVVERQPEIIAQELLRLLTDQKMTETMAGIGRERMGQPGGAARIADEIVTMLHS